MPFIRMIHENEAEGKLAELYARIGRARGGVANVMKIHSLHPDAMEKHFELYRTLMFRRSELSRPLREMLGVIVSAHNQCSYCVMHHAEPLRAFGIEEKIIETLKEGKIHASLPEAEQEMLRYAVALTRRSAAEQVRIERLRTLGWSDRAILDGTLIIGYFNFVNRVVLGLGVELEADFFRTCRPDDTED